MNKIHEKYRAVLGSGMGIEVLGDMAKECGLYDNIDTEEDRVLFNYFRSVLQKIGVFDREHIKSNAIIRKLMELPLMPENNDDWKQGHILPKGMKEND